MPYFYEVYHRDNPEGAVIIGFEEKPTPMRVKDKACKDGFFQWREYTNLVVRKTKHKLTLEHCFSGEVLPNGRC